MLETGGGGIDVENDGRGVENTGMDVENAGGVTL